MVQSLSIQISPDELRELVREEISTAIQPLVQGTQVSKSSIKPKTRKETAEILGISLPTLNQKTKEGIIKAHRFGGKVLYKAEDIEEALKKIKV